MLRFARRALQHASSGRGPRTPAGARDAAANAAEGATGGETFRVGFGRGARGGSGNSGRRVRVRFDGQPAGYIAVAVVAACVAYGIGKAEQPKPAHDKRKKQHEATVPAHTSVVPAFSPDAVQPYTAALPRAGQSSPSLPVLTSLTPAEVAAHPLLAAIAPYGLPQLPFLPLGANSDKQLPADFHLTPPLFLKHAYMSAFSPRMRTAEWTLELLTPAANNATSSADADSTPASRDHSSFALDPLISPSFQAPPSLFKHSGFDRGHLVPAADILPRAEGAQRDVDETFFQSNIVPQVASLNRGYWSQIENHVRKLANTHAHHHTFVITGPLFIPTAASPLSSDALVAAVMETTAADDDSTALVPSRGSAPRQQLRTEVLGAGGPGAPFVPVPTHFFKVVLLTPTAGSPDATTVPLQLGAFIVPNAPVSLSTPLSTFAVPLEHVEHFAGYHFFPRLPRGASADTRASRKMSSPLSVLLSSSSDASGPLVRDLCAAGGCDLKIRDFSHKAAGNDKSKARI